MPARLGDKPLDAALPRIRCTAEERAEAQEQAEIAGLSLGEYVRRRTFGRPVIASADNAMLRSCGARAASSSTCINKAAASTLGKPEMPFRPWWMPSNESASGARPKRRWLPLKSVAGLLADLPAAAAKASPHDFRAPQGRRRFRQIGPCSA